MNGKRWLALGIALGLFIVSIGFRFMTQIITTDWEALINMSVDELNEEVIEEGNPDEKIAVLKLEGVIQDTGDGSFLNTSMYNHERFLNMLEAVGKDRSVDGIVLRINSPGGGVVESAEIEEKIVDIRKTYNKPVYVSMGNTAASGGYYVSAKADKIVAHPATLTGSIGVIMESINFADLADDYGIDFNTIKSGKYKDIMSSSRKMTDEWKYMLQSMIDDMYDDFVQVIVDGRDLSEQRVRELGDGRVFTGSQAKENGLVDDLGNLDDTIAMLEKDYELNDPHVVQYRSKFGFKELAGVTAQHLFDDKAELMGVMELIRQHDGPRAMYLYSQ